ncbi:MAG: SDR family oxidoreductase [Chloroflexota bacterium]|nr:SDR family oxidoreductase [Dehalococcoidia bacterium]MDW8254651.1 SDR family oxidoreductase [Chloroflexota bacterium]
MAVLDRFRLDGRVAVVTGAGGGIGRATIALFREAGARVAGIDLNPDSFADLLGEDDVAAAADVRDPEAVRSAFAAIAARVGPPTVLVNNAGIAYRASVLETSPDAWDRVLAINLRGALLCSQAAAPAMLAAGKGSIVNVASQLAFAVAAERAAYVASKAGLIGLTKVMALEWADRGIRVNAVAPGVTRTPMVRYLEENREAGDAFRARIPLGRFAEPDEIALACLYLASDASSYVTGHVLTVDGGYSVP